MSLSAGPMENTEAEVHVITSLPFPPPLPLPLPLPLLSPLPLSFPLLPLPLPLPSPTSLPSELSTAGKGEEEGVAGLALLVGMLGVNVLYHKQTNKRKITTT